MAGDRVSFRIRGAALDCGSRAFYDVLQRSIMLNKVKVGGSDWPQRYAEISHYRHRFQEDFRQKHCGAPIKIYAAGMHFFHQSAKQAKIVMACGAERGSVGCRMHVRNVGADSEMNRHRNAESIGV